MAIPRIRMANSFTIRVTGMDETFTKAAWRKWLDSLGLAAQKYIAEQWEQEMTGTGRALKANSAEWTRQKISRGEDPRRGHQKNRLQRRLSGRRLFTVSGISQNGTATIVFSEARLIAAVPHAEFYAQQKVPILKRIMQLNQAAIAAIAAPLIGEVAAAQVAQTRGAPFRGRPPRIRPALGITQAFSRQIGATLTPAQRRAVERLIR